MHPEILNINKFYDLSDGNKISYVVKEIYPRPVCRQCQRFLRIPLETRWLRRNQSEVFKVLNGYENIDRNIFSHSRKRI